MIAARAEISPCGVTMRSARARMIDQAHRAIEAHVEAARVSLDQRAIAFADALVQPGVAIERVFAQHELR